MPVFNSPPTLPYYTKPGPMTTPGEHGTLLQDLPADVAGLADILHGLIIHEHIAGLYGVTLSDEDRASVHVRRAEDLLGLIHASDSRSLGIAREPSARLPGNCRHFTVLMVTMLRAQGVPARARCGFGCYFGNGLFEDHWVCEYWHSSEQQWKLVDAQIDARQLEIFAVDFDLTDVPRDRFLIAGDAWAKCREGAADPAAFGLSVLEESGMWWIAANLMRDAAALGNVELLPWDIWGVMPGPLTEIGADELVLFDQLAGYTKMADGAFDLLQHLCADDDRLTVPPTVRNALRNREEPL
ncbi:MAG TPA: transglutaminase-like domain-containing protein [Streptosporangiaceae bacterium]